MNFRFLTREETFIFIILSIFFGLDVFLLSKIAPDTITRQVIAWIIGIISFVLIKTANFRTEDLRKIDWLVYGIIVASLMLPIILGGEVRGSVRWFSFFGYNIQPSELTKPFYAIAITSLALKWKENNKRLISLLLTTIAIPSFIIFFQPDLGSTIMFLLIGSTILLLASKNKFQTSSVLFILLIIGIFFGALFLPEYQKQRITSFVNPQADPLGSGYNIIQSKIAIGSGRWLGKGFGTGEQTRLKFLPERHTDFIFSSFAESSGFLGVTILIVLYLIFFLLLRRKVMKAESEFDHIFKTSLLVQLFFQTFVNLGMNLGMLPITGLTLPFLSYGGSSLLTIFIMLAFLLK